MEYKHRLRGVINYHGCLSMTTTVFLKSANHCAFLAGTAGESPVKDNRSHRAGLVK
jgi:hypothetical protein